MKNKLTVLVLLIFAMVNINNAQVPISPVMPPLLLTLMWLFPGLRSVHLPMITKL